MITTRRHLMVLAGATAIAGCAGPAPTPTPNPTPTGDVELIMAGVNALVNALAIFGLDPATIARVRGYAATAGSAAAAIVAAVNPDASLMSNFAVAVSAVVKTLGDQAGIPSWATTILGSIIALLPSLSPLLGSPPRTRAGLPRMTPEAARAHLRSLR